MSKPKSYIARSDAEAKALHDGGQTVIVIPCEPQPPFDYWCHANGNLYGCRNDGTSTGYMIFPEEPDVIRKENGRARFDNVRHDPDDIWCPYSRGDVVTVKDSHLTVKSVECKQIRDITEDQAKRFGLGTEDFNRFPSLYEFAQKWKLGNSYRLAFAWTWRTEWESNPWAWFMEVEYHGAY